ncbi:sensor domain-containing protein [Mycolicibacterium anyangense]|uniref:Sensor domain-containing protein n=1 Tax=Mycolicibacterium anyangense TaxID=1431246 RepID=A0A6N4WBW4_9MYCO|nr:sensor domain-containing protein [Mycolicibacterium anyangense]BBZ76671.1 sensor domain-containing protein [Mycolicibacterium anyangense]
MLGITVLAGCAATVDGRAVPQTGPLRPLVSALPTSAEVSRIAGNPLSDNGSRPYQGGIGVLPNGIRDNDTARPIDCLGAVSPFMRIVYEKGDVVGAAWQEFSRYGTGQAVSSVDAGVVRFRSPGEAQRMFSAFAARWKACEGTTVTTFLPGPQNTELYEKVTDVRVDGAVLTAIIVNSDNQGGAQFPAERAVEVSADCIVDVDMAVTAGRAATADRAAGIARLMVERLG